MPRRALTGSRIRDRRLILGLKQSELARLVGISPSYLNLIEHNKRSIAGKLLTDLARTLEVELSALSEGAEAALLADLRAAAPVNTAPVNTAPVNTNLAAASDEPVPELDRIDEFAERFAGWAAHVARQHRRIETLERTIEILSDRLTHDPFLSASMHDVLSTVTSIRSSAAILAEPGEVDPNWQARFHKNIHEDAQRLYESAQALVSYLDAGGDVGSNLTGPQDELESYLAHNSYHIAKLEQPGANSETVTALIAAAPQFTSTAARAMADTCLNGYLADARALKLGPFSEAAQALDHDPWRLAQRFDRNMMQVMRRLACLPESAGGGIIGLVACDGSGTLTFRKPVSGFHLPRFGAACPLWPLYQSLARPLSPMRSVVQQAGRNLRPCITYSMAVPRLPEGFDAPVVLEAQMLIVAKDPATLAAVTGRVQEVGQSCRICPVPACVARREMSILGDGF